MSLSSPPPGDMAPRRYDAAGRAEVVAAAGPSGQSTLLVAVVVICALYFGREIFVPFALSVLLSFALAPPVMWLRRIHLPRVPAVILVVFLAFLAIFAFGAVVASQLGQLGSNIPLYQRNVETKIRSLHDAFPDTGIMDRASRMLERLGSEISSSMSRGNASSAEVKPTPVKIVAPDPAPLQTLQSVVGPLLGPLATAGLVIVFVIFMLLQREDLRDRLIRLAGTVDLQRTTTALDEAGHRVSRYLLMQLVVNVTYGIPVGLGLWLIGVPNAVLWGMLATLLRFVPYVGPFVAAAFPLALSVAVDPGWSMLLWAAALFVVLEVISNNVVEPILYGSSTGLSPVAIIVSAVFWTWLWGPIGLLLSTPLTVCLVVLGRHVPQLQFLDVILGNEAVLAPEQRFYQRLLAGDPEEATEQAESYIETGSVVGFYDDVALKALLLAQHDRARGLLDWAHRGEILDGVRTLVEHIEEEGTTETDPRPQLGGRALCLAARSRLDEAAAVLLADLLRREGMTATVGSGQQIAGSNLSRLEVEGVDLICLSYLDVQAMTHARYIVRRLRRRAPSTPILISFWNLHPDDAERRDPLAATGADAVAVSFAESVTRATELMSRSGRGPEGRTAEDGTRDDGTPDGGAPDGRGDGASRAGDGAVAPPDEPAPVPVEAAAATVAAPLPAAPLLASRLP